MVKKFIKNIDFLKMIRKFLVFCGIIFIISIFLAFTTLPYWGYRWLGTRKSKISSTPSTIILMGGGGMPSQSALMRSWYVQRASETYLNAKILIAMPGNIEDSTSTPQRMKKELVQRSIAADKIFFTIEGTNTRSQAIACAELLNHRTAILLVTSPEHMRRAVLSFEKVGFSSVYALPTFESNVEADLSYRNKDIGSTNKLVPDVGNNINARYQLWNHLKYEILIVREMIALTYYRLQGWI